MSNDVKVSPAVALAVGVVLAAWSAVSYIPELHIGLAVHIVTGAIVSVLGIYGLTAANQTILAKALPPRLLAALAAGVAALASALPLIGIGSTWHAVVAAALAVAAVLIPGVTQPVIAALADPGPRRV